MDKKVKPLYAVNNSFKCNYRFSKSIIKYVKETNLETVVALANAERIREIKDTGVNIEDVSGLEKGMEIVGFIPNVEATNHIEREFMAPSNRERDW